MTDEPENMTLKLLREMRAEQERLASMLGKVADAVTQIAETQELHTEALTRHSGILEHHSTILEHHSGLLEKIHETQRNYGGHLRVLSGPWGQGRGQAGLALIWQNRKTGDMT